MPLKLSRPTDVLQVLSAVFYAFEEKTGKGVCVAEIVGGLSLLCAGNKSSKLAVREKKRWGFLVRVLCVRSGKHRVSREVAVAREAAVAQELGLVRGKRAPKRPLARVLCAAGPSCLFARNTCNMLKGDSVAFFDWRACGLAVVCAPVIRCCSVPAGARCSCCSTCMCCLCFALCF